MEKTPQTKFEVLNGDVRIDHRDLLQIDKGLIAIGAQSFVKEILNELNEHKRAHIYSSLNLEDIVVNETEKATAFLLFEKSQGGSGGTQWDFHVELFSEGKISKLHIWQARSRSSANRDIKEFWYHKIDKVAFGDNSFSLRVKKVDNEHCWQLEQGKKYKVSRNPYGNQLVVDEESFDRNVTVSFLRPNSERFASWERKIFTHIPLNKADQVAKATAEALKKEYGEGLRYEFDFKPSFQKEGISLTKSGIYKVINSD